MCCGAVQPHGRDAPLTDIRNAARTVLHCCSRRGAAAAPPHNTKQNTGGTCVFPPGEMDGVSARRATVLPTRPRVRGSVGLQTHASRVHFLSRILTYMSEKTSPRLPPPSSTYVDRRRAAVIRERAATPVPARIPLRKRSHLTPRARSKSRLSESASDDATKAPEISTTASRLDPVVPATTRQSLTSSCTRGHSSRASISGLGPSRLLRQSLSGSRSELKQLVIVDEASLAALAKAFPQARSGKLRRFLAASSGSIGSAKAMLEKHYAWFARLPFDLFAAARPELVKGKMYRRGEDRMGRKLLVWQTSLDDPTARDLQMMALIWWALSVEATIDELSEQRLALGASAMPSGNFAEAAVLIDRVRNVQDLAAVRAAIPLLQEQFPNLAGAFYIAPATLALRVKFAILARQLNSQTRSLVRCAILIAIGPAGSGPVHSVMNACAHL